MINDPLTSLFDIDVYDKEFLKDPFKTYEYLQREKPVFYSNRYNAWVVSRYQDVKTLLAADPWETIDTGAAVPVAPACPYWTQSRQASGQSSDYFSLRAKSIQMQQLWLSLQPAKTNYQRLRSIYTSPLAPAKMAGFEPLLRANLAEVFEQIAGKSRLDIVADIAVPFTMKTIMAVFGIDRASGHEDLKRYSTDLLGLLGLDPGVIKRERGLMAMINLLNYFADQGSGQPDGLYASLVEQVKKGNMSEDELLSNMVLMILAGQETTMQLIVSIFYCFMRFPDELDKVRNGTTQVSSFIEEVLRYESPAPYISKFLITETRVADVLIPAKSKVILLIGAANRDPLRFEKAGHFMPSRIEHQHIAFGFGQRYCLGAALSRIEAKIVIDEFIIRFPNFRIDPEQQLKWVDDFRIRGLQQLWIDLNTKNQYDII
jgi:cytochrome P450